jgi:F0F1-type ATP synthase assembly protein I
LNENDSASPTPERPSDPDPTPDAGLNSEPGGTPRTQAQLGVLRLAGLGTELAGFTLVFLGIGYFVDSIGRHDTGWATAFGTLIGFTLGMIRFIRQVRKINED